MYFQVSCGYVCKREKKSTRFVHLVLTGVRVTNFFNIADFDLIFLHNTHILSVCLLVGLFVILFCLSCLSVCLLSVCLSDVQYCRYVPYVWILVFLYICLFFSLYQYFCTVCLSVCLSVYVCESLFLFFCTSDSCTERQKTYKNI